MSFTDVVKIISSHDFLIGPLDLQCKFEFGLLALYLSLNCKNLDFKDTGDTHFFQGFYDNEIIQTLLQIKNLGFLILQNCVSAIFLG